MSILNEITYNHDQTNMQSTGLTDTPAKLKLRANAFGNIRKAMQAKQTAESAKADFHIPEAYMAMDINGGDDSGNGGVTLVDSNLENQFPMNSPMTKRLKIKDQQFQALHATQSAPTIESNYYSANENGTSNIEMSNEKIAPVSSSMDQFNEIPRVENASNINFGDTIDPFTDGMMGMRDQPIANAEHVYEATPILSPEDKAQQQTEAAFAKLTETTTNYGNVCGMTTEAETELKKLQDELKKLDNQMNKKQRAVDQAQGKVEAQIAVIRDREQQRSEAIEMVYRLNDEIGKQNAFMQGLTNKKEDELQEIRDNIEHVKAQIQERQSAIAVKNNQLENLKSREKQLNEQEKEIFTCYEDILKSLDESKKQFEAIPIPESNELVEKTEASKMESKSGKEKNNQEENFDDEKVDSSMMSVPSGDDVIEFPSDRMRNDQEEIVAPSDVIDFSNVDFNEDLAEEGPNLVRSIGKVA